MSAIVIAILSPVIAYLKGTVLAKLDGYKTYLGLAALLALGVIQALKGNLTIFAALSINAFVLFGIRDAIAKLKPGA